MVSVDSKTLQIFDTKAKKNLRQAFHLDPTNRVYLAFTPSTETHRKHLALSGRALQIPAKIFEKQAFQ